MKEPSLTRAPVYTTKAKEDIIDKRKTKYFTPVITEEDRYIYENRASKYNEIPTNQTIIEDISNEEYATIYPDSCDFPDEYFEALQKAIEQLTDKQKFIVNGWLAGKTQQEMTDELGLSNNSAISLMWHGNAQGYGGIIKKFRKLLEDIIKDHKAGLELNNV